MAFLFHLTKICNSIVLHRNNPHIETDAFIQLLPENVIEALLYMKKQ